MFVTKDFFGSSGRMVKAVVLAGGKGTRFMPYTEIIPKPMIPVGPDEKPVLEVIMEWLKRHGITDFVFLCGYKWKYIYNYFKDGGNHEVKIQYSIDDEEYRGSGGALLKAFKTLLMDEENVLVWYGDIIAPIKVDKLLEEHMLSGAQATLVVTERYRVPVGIAHISEENRIIKLEEKPWLSFSATIGVLVIKREPVLQAEGDLGKKFDIMGDLIPWMISRGYDVRAFYHKGKWFDVGSLEKYVKIKDDPLWASIIGEEE